MAEPTMETLARRLDRVERENRCLKQAGVVALAVISAVVLMGQATGKVAKVIEAEKFVLRNSAGKVVAMLGVPQRWGYPQMHFYDQEKKVAVLGIVREDGSPGLRLYDGNDKLRASLISESLSDGTPILELYDKNEKSRATFTLLWPLSDLPALVLSGENKGGISLGRNLEIYDAKGATRAVLGRISLGEKRTGIVEKRPESSLVLFDKDGKLIWSAP